MTLISKLCCNETRHIFSFIFLRKVANREENSQNHILVLSILKRIFNCVYVCVVYGLRACECSAGGDQKRAPDLLELKLKVVVGCPWRVLEIKLHSFASAASTLTVELSLQPQASFFF